MHYFQNMVWLVVVSITNLGFGDVVPKSPGGRIFVGIASILGTLLTALMIGVMRDWLEIPVSTFDCHVANVKVMRMKSLLIQRICYGELNSKR